MKKIVALLLALMMLLCLCACGGPEEASAPEEEKPEAPVVAEVSDSDLEAEAPLEESSGNVVVAPGGAEEEEESVDQEMFGLAMDCIGLSPADLMAAIGEPDATEYTSSCLEDNAEDGMLYYNEYGFYVWTLRYPGGTETIQDVLEM